MYTNTPPRMPEQPIRPPMQIERPADTGQEKLPQNASIKKMAKHAVEAKIIGPDGLKLTEADIEDAKNDEIINNLVKKYERKGGVEIVLPDSSVKINNLGGDTTPNQNIAIVCKENSFPILLEFRKPNRGTFDMNIFVEGQSYTDPKIGKEQLSKIIEKYKNEGFIITKADIGMPEKTDDNGLNTIYTHIAGELAEIVENSKHINDMHVEVTPYNSEQTNKKSGVIFSSSIEEGGHSTTAKINDEVIPSSPAYTNKFV